jgi:ABC-type nitrate/sulfonate/bicarbonate transport system permease component
MAIAVLALIVLEVLSGSMGAGANLIDLPATRRGWRNLIVVVLVMITVMAVGIYLFDPAGRQSRP